MSDRRYKVSEKQIAMLRTEYAQGKTLREIAEAYSISINYAWKIIHGASHKKLNPLVCPHCHEVIRHF